MSWPRPSGRTPTAVAAGTAGSLLDAASQPCSPPAQAQDADALMTQGSFLRTKFSGSDLDL